MKKTPHYFEVGSLETAVESLRCKLFRCSIGDEGALPKHDAFHSDLYGNTLLQWAERWKTRDREDAEQRKELVQELFRFGLGKGQN